MGEGGPPTWRTAARTAADAARARSSRTAAETQRRAFTSRSGARADGTSPPSAADADASVK